MLRQFTKEFREFAIKGNAIDLAVGVMIGAAFQRIVNSIVNDIVMPPIGALLNGTDFADLFINLSSTEVTSLTDAKEKGVPTLNYGMFINEVLTFFIVAVTLFIAIKMMNTLRRTEERREKREAEKKKEK